MLSNDGGIYVHLDWKKGHYIKTLLDEVFGESNFRNEIVWKRTRASHSDATYYGRVHDIIFFYGKSGTGSFEQQYTEHKPGYIDRFSKVDSEGRKYMLVPLHGPRQGPARLFFGKNIKPPRGRCWPSQKVIDEYISQGLVELTTNGTPSKRSYLDRNLGAPVSDWWDDVIPLNPVARERTGYPTQKPEELLQRIIETSSKPGDIIMDIFAGSGTTPAVAEKLRRRWIAIDCGKLAVYTVQKRMLNLHSEIGESGKLLHPKPFTLFNAGLYDFDSLRQLPWEKWRFFALQLFSCKDELHKIRGFQLDGKRQGASVLVFNHFTEGTISYETIADIHSSVGKQIGSRCFIIAPRGAFLFQEDYIELDGVRYYALRIPYSFINEIHTREFSALSQPSDETAVNETVEAVGFDFIQAPTVDFVISQTHRSPVLKIKKFESKARVRGEETIGGLETLSMVMADFSYKGNVFELDKAYYAQDLKRDGWSIELPVENITGDVMFVFLDIYGNEARIAVAKDHFKADKMLKRPTKKYAKTRAK